MSDQVETPDDARASRLREYDRAERESRRYGPSAFPRCKECGRYTGRYHEALCEAEARARKSKGDA